MAESLSEVKVVIDTRSVRCSATGTVTGAVFVNLGEKSFPEEDWSDLVLAVVRGWIEAVLRLLENQSDTSELMFLDGPFWLQVTRGRSETWVIECLTNRVKPRTECLQETSWRPFVASLVAAAEGFGVRS